MKSPSGTAPDIDGGRGTRGLPPRRLTLLLSLAVFGLALAPRVIYLAELRAHSPTFDRPEGGDSIFYDRVASGESTPARAYFHSPLYRGFLIAVYRVVGRDLLLVRLLQHLLGALTAVVVFFLGLRLFSDRRVAVIAALMMAWCGPGIFYEGQLLVDAIMPLLVALSCLSLVWLIEDPRASRALLAGAVVGLTALGRATVLAWLPLAVVWLLVAHRDWRRSALVAVGAAVIIAPITVRNYVVEKDLVLITSNAGLNLYIGNNPQAAGTYNLPEGLWFRPGDPTDDFAGIKVATLALGHRPRSSELSRWWTQKALTYVKRRPGRVVGLSLKKAALLINDYEQPQLYNYYAYRDVGPLLRFLPGVGLILALGLVGVVWAFWRSRSGPVRFVVLLGLLFGLTYLPFFVVGRYRLPLVVLFSGLAAWVVTTTLDALRARQWRQGLGLVAAVAAALLLCFAPLGPRPKRAAQYAAFGRAALLDHDFRAAARWYGKAARDQPLYVEHRAELGRALLKLGRHRRALTVLERARDQYPKLASLHRFLGQAYLRTGQPRRAERSLRRAVDLDPGALRSWVALGDLLAGRRARGPAAQAYRSALQLAGTAGPLERLALRLKLLSLKAR